MGSSQLSFHPAAYRHDIERADTVHAVDHTVAVRHLDPEPPDRPDTRVLYIGPNRNGHLLEIVTIPTDTGEIVIHAMNLRPSTQTAYL